MGEHSRLSPSSASRWLNCPGSARLDLPDESNEAADRGTAMHETAAEILSGLTTTFVSREEKDLIEEYVEYVRGVPGEQHYEQRIISHIEPEFGGTVDCVSVTDDALHVVDFKSGHGRVEAEDNKQLKSYLCLAREKFGARERYYGHIVQPRLGAPTCQEFTWRELDEHERQVWAAATDKSLHAGSWCKFCPLALACETRQKYDKERVAMAFDDHPSIEWCLEVIEIADVMAKRKQLAEARLLRLALAGQEIPGQRLASSLADRAWTDPEIAQTALGLTDDEFFTRKPNSPAVAEQLVREKLGGGRGTLKRAKEQVNKLVERKQLGPILVPLSSKLPEWRPVSPEVFEDGDAPERG